MDTKEMYITITGLKHYYGTAPFKVDNWLILKKDPHNSFDSEAIEVIAPMLNRIGYVANSPYTVLDGTFSAGRVYDRIPKKCCAKVVAITGNVMIAKVYPNRKLKFSIKVKTVKINKK